MANWEHKAAHYSEYGAFLNCNALKKQNKKGACPMMGLGWAAIPFKMNRLHQHSTI